MIVPIVIGPPPSPSSASSASAAINPDTNAFDLSYPPIALKGDTIILNPAIFSNLTPDQLKELEQLGARKAIEILQSYIVRFLKEKIKTEGSKGKTKKKSKTKRADGNAVEGKKEPKSKGDVPSNPFTTAPLAMRKPPTSGVASSSPKNVPVPPLQHPTGYQLPAMHQQQQQQQQMTYRTASPGMSGLQAAVAPLRLSSPPMVGLTDPADEIIDIMGDDSSTTIVVEEPASKRRRVEVEAAAMTATATTAV